MADAERTCVVVGGGAFGLPAAVELRARGWQVDLVDPGPLPHPRAASTDISKAVRMDYGSDDLYVALAAEAMRGWRRCNARWGETVYREVGFLLMTREAMRPGGFEYEGLARLRAAGVPVVRFTGDALPEVAPAWDRGAYPDGYFNPEAGWVASGTAIARWAGEAARAGVRLHVGESMTGLVERDDRIAGVVLASGNRLAADRVVVAAGAWTPKRLPELSDRLTPTAQQVLHFRPRDPRAFRGTPAPVWGADISRTGWYGFPLTDDGLVKIGHHGPGRPIDPDAPRVPDPEITERCREFLAAALPALAGAEPVEQRVCLYCDSHDGDFLIDEDPDRPGLVVASGGSGHGFKFAPLLGELVADAVERRPRAGLDRFRWREAGPARAEQARLTD